MALPKWIPRVYRNMMMTAEDLRLERDFQTEARLQNQFKDDKIRAVQKIAIRIEKKKEFIRQTKGEAQKMLKNQLLELEEEQFLLLRDEILNACKDSAGGIDKAKLRKVPGSSIFFKNKNKPKPKIEGS